VEGSECENGWEKQEGRIEKTRTGTCKEVSREEEGVVRRRGWNGEK
jgi:hypothetical protein